MQAYTHEVMSILKGSAEYTALGNTDGIEGKLQVSRFADGEMEVSVDTSVRGRDVFLFANASRNPLDLSVEECKVEIYHAVDALRRAQAASITLFEPYCSCGRSDRTTRRNSVGLWMHYKTLVGLGVNHIITYQLHSDLSKTMVDPTLCAFDNVPAQVLLKRHIADNFIRSEDTLLKDVRSRWLFCSVDAGGEGMAKRFGVSFGTSIVIAHKQRDYSTTNKIESVNILSSVPIEGRSVWVIDDMIDTASSVYVLVKELARRGVASVNIAVIHAVCSGPACERLHELCESGYLKNLIVCDTIACPQKMRDLVPCLRVVSSAELSAAIVFRLNQDMALSDFFMPFNARRYLA